MIIDLDCRNFDQVVQSGRPVLVDFWAEWCAPCKLMNPIVEGVATRYHARITVARVNADKNVEIANRFGISELPAFMVFFKGQAMDSMLGSTTRMRFESWVEQCLRENNERIGRVR